MSKEEAIKIYEMENAPDKIETLKYRPDKEVHLYQCQKYFNYMYGYMAPSTGYLNRED